MNDALLSAITLDALDLLLGHELRYLDERRGFTRYAVSAEESVWTCDDCGAAWVDPDEGCEHCGQGNPDNWEADEQARQALDDA